MRVAVVGNCQAGAIAEVLDRSPDCVLDAVIDLNMNGTEAFAHAEYALLHRQNVDFVLTQKLGPAHGDLCTENLNQIYKERCMTYTNIYFSGLHPDITYFGEFKNRVESPIGDYHSRICLYGFFSGKSSDDTVKLFSFDTYKRMGFLTEFDKSKMELVKRDQELNVQVARRLFDIVHLEPVLLSLNHPTGRAVHMLADELHRRMCGYGLQFGPEYTASKLANNCIWPIYSEIGHHHGLAYGTPQLYCPPIGIGKKGLRLAEFVKRSFDLYREQGLSPNDTHSAAMRFRGQLEP